MAPAKRPICANRPSRGAVSCGDSLEWRPTTRVSECALWATKCRGHFIRTSCPMSPPRVHTMILGNGGELEYMYEPVTNTVLTGLRAELHSHEIRELRTIIGQHGQTRDPSFPLRMQPEKLLAGRALRAGDVFVWVGASGHDQVPWRALRDLGLYTIYYQSEPVRSCSLSRAEVDEIWDFSWSNIDSCVDSSHMPACDAPPVRRYVPLVPSAVPVSLQHLSDPADSMPEPAPSLVFFGAPVFRQACLDFLSQRLKTRIIVQNKIWNTAAFERWLTLFETPPIFLNLHKGCQVPSARSSERSRVPTPITWRNPKLISRGLLVISEPAYHKDEAEFEGLIDFAPLPALVERFHHLQAMSGALRRKLALSRLHNFRSRFNASGVFARAGIYTLLRYHRTHTRECTVDNSTPAPHRTTAPCCVFPRCLPASADDT